MSIPYFYETIENIEAGVLSEESAHHALHVLRMKTGQGLCMTDGKGLLAKAVIQDIGKKSCHIQLTATQTVTPKTSHLTIAVAFTKNPSRMEWFLEKATEMGLSRIIPLVTKRSEKIHTRRDRFEKIMISAMLQSQQCFLPELSEPLTLDKLLHEPFDVRCIAHCLSEQKRQFWKDEIEGGKKNVILIGPEGDFTEEEIHLCLQHNYHPVSLGHNRLRTETAALYACSVFQSQTETYV